MFGSVSLALAMMSPCAHADTALDSHPSPISAVGHGVRPYQLAAQGPGMGTIKDRHQAGRKTVIAGSLVIGGAGVAALGGGIYGLGNGLFGDGTFFDSPYFPVVGVTSIVGMGAVATGTSIMSVNAWLGRHTIAEKRKRIHPALHAVGLAGTTLSTIGTVVFVSSLANPDSFWDTQVGNLNLWLIGSAMSGVHARAAGRRLGNAARSTVLLPQLSPEGAGLQLVVVR